MPVDVLELVRKRVYKYENNSFGNNPYQNPDPALLLGIRIVLKPPTAFYREWVEKKRKKS